MFIGRLDDDDGGGENASAIEPDGLPTNSAVHWLPRVPGLVSVTHSESWISVVNLNAGADSPQSAVAAQHASLHVSAGPRTRHTSHRVAEAFGDEVDLSNSSPPPPPPPAPMRELHESVSELSVGSKSPVDSAHGRSQSLEPSPQPLPCLRLAPRWMKRPCGAHFGFGSRLVSFTTGRPSDNLSSDPGRRQSTNGSNMAPDTKESTSRLVHIHHVDATDPTSVHTADTLAEPEEKRLPTLISWLNDALTHGAPDAWSKFGDEFSGVCQPRVLLSATGRIDPWDFVRAGLHYSADQLPSVFSQLLGYPSHVVQNEVEQALSQSCEQLSDSSSLDRSNDAPTVVNSVLSAMKKALVSADLVSTCRLAVHNALSALPNPGFSPLASVAVILSTKLGLTELYAEVRKSVLDYVDRMANHLDPRFDQLRAVALLFTALLLDDWSIISSQWPLDDWSTCLTAMVNHVWAKDAKLFRDLCATVIARLLDTKAECSLSRAERCTAAWICAVCSGNLDGLVDAWYGLDSVAVDDVNGKQLLPLALQLVLLTRSQLCPHDASPLTAAPVTHVFLTVASWLGQRGLVADSTTADCSTALVALRLLQPHCRLGQDAYAPACQEVAHRIWCGLSDEERRLANVDPRTLFGCPYERSTHTQCPCGLNAPAAIGHPAQRLHHASRTAGPVQPPYMTPQHTLPAMMGMPPLMPTMAMSATPAVPPISATPANLLRGTSVPGAASPSVHMVGPSPTTFFPPTLPPSQTWTPPAVTPPSAPQLPPPPPAPHLGPTPPTPQMSTVQPTMFQPTSTLVPDSNPPPPDWSKPQQPPPAPPLPPPLSHGRTSVSAATPGWNDPPMLSHTYKPPVQPVVSVNHFYDPAQYAGSSVNYPSPPVANTPAPSSLPPQPSSFSKPPAAAAVPMLNPPASSPYSYPAMGMPAYQAPAPVLAPPMNSGSVQQPPSVPRYADETAGAEIGALGLCPMTNRSANLPGDQWPAAVPLGTVSAVNGASNHQSPQPTAVSAASGNATTPSTATGGVPQNPETEFMVHTLTGLIQSCRTVGGKAYSVKMDTVERRLGPLFQSLQSNDLSGPVLDHLRVCVEAVSRSDFASALAHANRLIQSAAGFESIHGFAPGLKILMQTARQLWPNDANRYPGVGTTEATANPWSIPAN